MSVSRIQPGLRAQPKFINHRVSPNRETDAAISVKLLTVCRYRELPMPLDERVLCIPAPHFRAVGPFEGFCRADEAYRRSLLDASQYHFLPRSEVETDPNWLQLIPYVLLVCEAQVFHYRRGASGTEARLRALRSVGIGGHISEADAAGGGDPYLTGMHREVSEEVTHAPVTNESWLGFIFDPRTPVGSVHLGVVHIWELAEASAVAKETALANAGFAPLAELMPQREQFETWSQFVFDELSDSAH